MTSRFGAEIIGGSLSPEYIRCFQAAHRLPRLLRNSLSRNKGEGPTEGRKPLDSLLRRFSYCEFHGMCKCVLPGRISRSSETGSIEFLLAPAWIQLRWNIEPMF